MFLNFNIYLTTCYTDTINPFTVPACNISWAKMCTPENSIFDGPMTNQPSILCILIETICTHAKGGKSLSGFIFGIFDGRFLSEGAASIEVKGLTA